VGAWASGWVSQWVSVWIGEWSSVCKSVSEWVCAWRCASMFVCTSVVLIPQPYHYRVVLTFSCWAYSTVTFTVTTTHTSYLLTLLICPNYSFHPRISWMLFTVDQEHNRRPCYWTNSAQSNTLNILEACTNLHYPVTYIRSEDCDKHCIVTVSSTLNSKLWPTNSRKFN
jgi:hypothetical protein